MTRETHEFLPLTSPLSRSSVNMCIVSSSQVPATMMMNSTFHHSGVPVARPRDMKVSALSMLDEHRMLVLERTDFKAKIFLVDLRQATNILGTIWDDVNNLSSLETLNADGALEDNEIIPLPKKFVLTLDSTLSVNGVDIPEKIEGMTVLDGKTIAVANDNDFGVGNFEINELVDPPTCTLVDSGKESQIILIRLAQPLK